MLDKVIKNHLQDKKILLMTHLVLGYPSFEENRKMIAEMSEADVELIELQIPFSEPTADGPVILEANFESLKNGTKVSECFEFAKEIVKEYPKISFLFMTYYNILFAKGERHFIEAAKECGIKGLIVPDIPPEEDKDYTDFCESNEIDPVFIFTPTSTPERLKELSKHSRGLIYAVGRRGVTGSKTNFDQEIADQIKLYRDSTELPLALGFGVQEKADVDFLVDKVDIAVIGSQLIRIQQNEGSEAVGSFLKSLR